MTMEGKGCESILDTEVARAAQLKTLGKGLQSPVLAAESGKDNRMRGGSQGLRQGQGNSSFTVLHSKLMHRGPPAHGCVTQQATQGEQQPGGGASCSEL